MRRTALYTVKRHTIENPWSMVDGTVHSRVSNVELTVTDDGLGRHDITITEKSGSLRNCDGYTPPTTTPPATNPPSSNTGSSGGSNAVCSIGMNVETCEDRLGLFPGERFPYIDCSGRGRTILWASNWWIIGVQGDYAVLSKSPYECD